MIYTAIDTFYLTQDQLQESPSRKDGVDESTEAILRLYGCELIQEGGILLKLPQAVMATGQVLLHRFFCKKSLARFNVKRVAASCLWLAAKLEENPRRVQHVLLVFNRMECRRENKSLELLDPFSKKYEEMKLDLIRTERHLLKEMGFICHVEHPHKFIISYLLQLEASPELMQEAWSLANDSLRTTLCVRFKSEVVACGVIYAAARRFQVTLPENPSWWRIFDAEREDIDEVCRVLAWLYKQPKAKYIEVGKDTKSFVLTSRAWEAPANLQDCLPNSGVSNGVKKSENLASTADTRDHIVKAALDKLRNSSSQESKKHQDEIRASTANGDAYEQDVKTNVKTTREREESNKDDVNFVRAKKKDRDRSSKSRHKDKDDRRDRGLEVEGEEDWERGKDKEHRSKDRTKDSGYTEKSRHHTSSREREYYGSHKASRDKDRHRHHPYS